MRKLAHILGGAMAMVGTVLFSVGATKLFLQLFSYLPWVGCIVLGVFLGSTGLLLLSWKRADEYILGQGL